MDKNFGDLNETQEEYLNYVLESGQRLLTLINDILDLSKVEAGKQELELTDVDLQWFLENSLIMFKQKALKHGIDLSLETEQIPETIVADQNMLKRVIYNLLSNALKFTPDGGRIRVKALNCYGFPSFAWCVLWRKRSNTGRFKGNPIF
ncbi:MAG: hypothetical protein KAS19_05600 [Anaerolineales bacterium]|nr:hypothetical protein [Anaerolineales bacterium]